MAQRFSGERFNAERAKSRRAAEDRLQSSRPKLTMQCNRTADEHRRDSIFLPFVIILSISFSSAALCPFAASAFPFFVIAYQLSAMG